MNDFSNSPQKPAYWLKHLLLSLTALLCVESSLFAQDIKLNQQVYVQIKSTKLRSEPKQWATAVETLNYADTLTVLEQIGDWLKVNKLQGEKQGYIHKSAVRGSKILLAATNEAILSTSAEETDVFLAGKGFSAGVLDEYLKKSAKTNPESLQVMKGSEHFDQKQFKDFVTKGKLKDV